jgi:uncharacterized phage protein (TIGR01671 family)
MNKRELKFRVWNSEQKKFEYFELHNITVPDRLLNQNNFPVQQYTGLKDKNGKDIYEGDIISVGFYCAEEHGVVKFGEYCGKDYYANDGYGWFVDHGFDVHTLVKNWAYESSVVGNIFENSELLNK